MYSPFANSFFYFGWASTSDNNVFCTDFHLHLRGIRNFYFLFYLDNDDPVKMQRPYLWDLLIQDTEQCPEMNAPLYLCKHLFYAVIVIYYDDRDTTYTTMSQHGFAYMTLYAKYYSALYKNFICFTLHFTYTVGTSTIATYNVLTGLFLSYKNMAPASKWICNNSI